MRLTLNFDLTEVKNKLQSLNANVKVPNEFVSLSLEGNLVAVRLHADKSNEVVFNLDVTCLPCFNYGLTEFVGKIDCDKNELEVFTFADLHTHTEYSILDGANRIKDLSKKYGYYGAITDHGVMYGCVDFFKKMKDLHKKPILGFEAYTDSFGYFYLVPLETTDEVEAAKLRAENKAAKYHLIILFKNEIGYENGMKLCSYGQANKGGSFPERPRVSWEELLKYKEGLVILSACIGGEIPQKIIKGDLSTAKEMITVLKREFGEDFYLEIQRHASMSRVQSFIDAIQFELGTTITFDEVKSHYDAVKDGSMKRKEFEHKYSRKLYREVELLIEETLVNDTLIELSKEFGVKVVATTDAHYLNAEDADFHEALLCNQTKSTLSDPKHYSFAGEGYYVHTNDEMEKLFSDIPEALINTIEVANKCNFEYKFGEYKLPKFPIPEGYTDKEYLRKLALDGFKERFKHLDPQKRAEYMDRLEFELATIFKMGYQGYFFIVWDYIRYAKENGIYVGPGRGSGAGSIVLYCLHITENLDPIKYDLLFEREMSCAR